MLYKYLASELQLQPSVLVERGNFRVCLIGVMIFCGSNVTRMFSMSQNGIAKKLRTTSESRSLLSKLSFFQRARFEAHPGALEAAGLTLLFKWLLQSVSRHT